MHSFDISYVKSTAILLSLTFAKNQIGKDIRLNVIDVVHFSKILTDFDVNASSVGSSKILHINIGEVELKKNSPSRKRSIDEQASLGRGGVDEM